MFGIQGGFQSGLSPQLPRSNQPTPNLTTILRNSVKEATAQLIWEDNHANSLFNDIICPEATALPGLHANLVTQIDGSQYIVGQFPKDNFRFWTTMILNCPLIVNLLSQDEFDKLNNVFQIYPQNVGEKIRLREKDQDGVPYGPCKIVLECIHQQVLESFNEEGILIASQMLLKPQAEDGGEPQQDILITVFNLKGWKDHAGTAIPQINSLIKYMDAYLHQAKQMTGLTLKPYIHCRAGVGRSGTVVTLRTIKHLIDQGQVSRDNYITALKEVILQGRRDRGPHFVQCEAQFDTCIRATEQMLEEKETQFMTQGNEGLGIQFA